MSNDLISRSALVDELKQSGMIVDNDYGNAMLDFINNQPTVYDVDKVVDQIKEVRGKENVSAVPKIRICDAIEIVKAGGIE